MANPKRKAPWREVVAERAGGRCEYCQSPRAFAHENFSIEHVLPRSKEGKSSFENLALSCQGCNNHKYTKTEAVDPLSHEMVPIFNPRLHLWREHFRWSDDGTIVIGITSIGRATVEALQLNRVMLVNLRRVLVNSGEHPPADERATRE
jgi:hypothetical protein